MVSPPPGVSSADRVPPSASVRPRATASPRPRPPLPVSSSRWNGSNIRSRSSGGMPGPRSTTITSTVSGSTCASTRTGRPRGVPDGVADQVGDHPLEQAGVGGDQGSGLLDLEAYGVRLVAGDRQRQHLVEAAGAQHRVDQPALQPGQVEQVVDEPLQLLGGVRPRNGPARAGRPRRRRARAARRRRRAWWPAASGGRARPPAAAPSRWPRRARGSRPARRARGGAGTPAPARSAPRTPRAPAGRSRAAARRRAPARGCRRPGPGCRPRRGWTRTGKPDEARTTQPAGPCFSSETASWPNVSRSRSTIASAVSWPVSTDLDSPLIVAASARARSASAARRDARSTTVATAAATATNTSSASRFFGSETVSVPTGGVKK